MNGRGGDTAVNSPRLARAWWRLSQGSDRGAVALSRNAQAEQRSIGLRQGWLWSRLSRAGLNSGSDSDGG